MASFGLKPIDLPGLPPPRCPCGRGDSPFRANERAMCLACYRAWKADRAGFVERLVVCERQDALPLWNAERG